MPDDLAAYGAFFGTLVAHTRGRVRRFGVENEVIAPNHWKDTPAEYFQLLKVAADAAHAADPDAIVLDSVGSSGGFSIVEARKQWLAGDLEGALATIQQSQTNDLGGGPYLTSTDQVPVYLSAPRVSKMQEFYDQLVAHRDLIDALQLHYYGPASGIPSLIAMVRADGFGMPIEIWELGHRYLDDRPFDLTDHADESTRLIATAVGEGARYAVLQQYFDKPDNQMYGLIDGAGNSRPARFAARNTISMLKGARSATRLRAGSGTDGYRFDRADGWRRVLWATGDPVEPGRRLGVHSTTVAVTGNQSGTAHRKVSSVLVGSSPQWFEPDMIELTRRSSKRRRHVRVRARCPAASPTRFCRGRIKVRGAAHNRLVIATRKYKVGRNSTRVFDLRRRHRREKKKGQGDLRRAVQLPGQGQDLPQLGSLDGTASHFGQDDPTAAIQDVQHLGEAVISAVIRVGHVELTLARHLPEEPDPRWIGAFHRDQISVVGAVHRQDQVELIEIGRADLACRAADRHPARFGCRDRPRISRVADVPVTGAGRIDLDPFQAFAFDQAEHHRLGRGRAADVAETDEQDPQGRISRRSGHGSGKPGSAAAGRSCWSG